jgi:hypothetical protein
MMIRRTVALAVAGVLVIAASASAAQSGTYSGKTSQHLGTISLKVSGNKVVHVKFADGVGHGAGCSSFGKVQPQFPVSFKSDFAIKHGKFSGHASPRSQEVFKISGHVSGKRITGSFTDVVPIGQETGHGTNCSSGKVTFTATLAK